MFELCLANEWTNPGRRACGPYEGILGTNVFSRSLAIILQSRETEFPQIPFRTFPILWPISHQSDWPRETREVSTYLQAKTMCLFCMVSFKIVILIYSRKKLPFLQWSAKERPLGQKNLAAPLRGLKA